MDGLDDILVRLDPSPALALAERARLGEAWGMPNVLITPHVAISGTPYRQKWEELLLENCRRFAGNEPLLNVVYKTKWY